MGLGGKPFRAVVLRREETDGDGKEKIRQGEDGRGRDAGGGAGGGGGGGARGRAGGRANGGAVPADLGALHVKAVHVAVNGAVHVDAVNVTVNGAV